MYSYQNQPGVRFRSLGYEFYDVYLCFLCSFLHPFRPTPLIPHWMIKSYVATQLY